MGDTLCIYTADVPNTKDYNYMTETFAVWDCLYAKCFFSFVISVI